MHLKKRVRSAIAIFGGTVGLVAAMITIWSFLKGDEPKAPPGTSVLIIQGTDGAGKIELGPAFQKGSIREGADIIRLRAMSGVRELRGTEESASISKLPKGVFGYLSDSWLAMFPNDIDRWTLHRKKSTTRPLEMHKTSGGELLLFGYVSEGDLGRLQNSAGDREVEMFILFEPRKEYRFLVGIPVLRMKDWDSRRGQELGDFAWIKVR